MSVAAAVPRGATAAADASRTTRPWYAASWFWVRRYAPPEVAGTLTMVAAGMLVAALGAPVWVVGITGALAESIGFYAVAGIAVWREQRGAFPDRRRLGILIRVVGLLLLEFGPAELLDTALVRPVAIAVGVAFLPFVAWGLIAGKVAADIVFYVLAATAFRVSEKSGLRGDAS